MLKNSSVWRSVYCAWDLCCDIALPAVLRPNHEQNNQNTFFCNVLYVMPILGALLGLFWLIIGRIAAGLLPVNGAALIFALLLTGFGELRTSGRALALVVSFLENIFKHKNFITAVSLRKNTLHNNASLLELLLAVGLLGGKFFAVFLTARTGHFGIAGAAFTIALGCEAIMAAEPAAIGMMDSCRHARTEYIVGIIGFLLLFNLISLPLATLITTAAAVVIAVVIINMLLRKIGKITSDDMSMTGYILEFAVWLIMAILIG